MHLNRRTVRLVGAAAAGLMALIYFLIGLGVLSAGTTEGGDAAFLLAFGAAAGGAFLLGAVLLVATDRRWLWILGALLQLFVYVGYFAVAADRTPAFEIWGVTLRIVQIPLLAALLYLAFGAAPTSVQHIRRDGHGRDRRRR